MLFKFGDWLAAVVEVWFGTAFLKWSDAAFFSGWLGAAFFMGTHRVDDKTIKYDKSRCGSWHEPASSYC